MVGAIGFALLLSAMVWLLRSWRGEVVPESDGQPLAQERTGIEEILYAKSIAELPEQRKIPELVRRFLEALGGRKLLDGVTGIRASGTLLLNEEAPEIPFVMVKRGVGKMKIFLTRPDGVLTSITYSDGRAWKEEKFRQRSIVVEDLPASSLYDLSRNAMVLPELYQLSSRPEWSANYMGMELFEGVSCHKIHLTGIPGEELFLFLDSSSYLERGRLQVVASGEKEEQFKTINDNFQEVDGLIYPFTIETYRDGVFNQRIIIESVSLNPGLLPSLFLHPEER